MKVITSDYRMALGSRQMGLTDGRREHHPDQPYVVLREATADEWQTQRVAAGFPNEQGREFFYLVSVD